MHFSTTHPTSAWHIYYFFFTTGLALSVAISVHSARLLPVSRKGHDWEVA